MVEYEYEVRFVIGAVNVLCIVWVNEEYVGEMYATLEDKAWRYAQTQVENEAGFVITDDMCEQVLFTLTGTIGG